MSKPDLCFHGVGNTSGIYERVTKGTKTQLAEENIEVGRMDHKNTTKLVAYAKTVSSTFIQF